MGIGADPADPWWSHFEKYGGALEYDINDDYVDVGTGLGIDYLMFLADFFICGNIKTPPRYKSGRGA